MTNDLQTVADEVFVLYLTYFRNQLLRWKDFCDYHFKEKA